MVLDCTVCTNGIGSDGQTCKVCGGDSELNLTDAHFTQLISRWKIHGLVWNEILTQLADLTDKVNDVMDKCNDIKEKLDET